MAEHQSSQHAGHGASDTAHGHATRGPDGHGTDDHGHGGLAKYGVVFGCLCLLTGASFFTYSDLWPFKSTPAVGWAFMMAVSCTKAMLVICFFMHLLWEANWKYVLTIPASVMSIFLCLALVGDIGMRTRYYAEERWLHSSEPRHRDPGHDGTNHSKEPDHAKDRSKPSTTDAR